MLRPPTILLFHAGALGDFVLSWPLAMALQRWRPEAEVVYVTHAGKGRLAHEYLGTQFRDLEGGGWHLLGVSKAALPETSRALLRGSLAVVTFLVQPGEEWLRHAQEVAPGAQWLPLRSIPPRDYRQHATGFQREQLAAIPELASHFDAALEQLHRHGLDRWRPGRRILIHPGSGSPAKCWPWSRFVKLARELKLNHEAAFLLGEVELERWGAPSLEQLEQAAALLTPRSPLELAHELCQARLLLANDTGPGHLAGILGVPVVSLFGPTRREVWEPLGPRVWVTRSSTGEMAGLSEGAVARLVEDVLSRGRPAGTPILTPPSCLPPSGSPAAAGGDSSARRRS